MEYSFQGKLTHDLSDGVLEGGEGLSCGAGDGAQMGLQGIHMGLELGAQLVDGALHGVQQVCGVRLQGITSRAHQLRTKITSISPYSCIYLLALIYLSCVPAMLKNSPAPNNTM